jgi:hypothetical protein
VKTKMYIHDTPDTTVFYECLICGVNHMLSGKGAICIAYEDELAIGNICWECITKGPMVAQERLRSHVARIDELTKRLEALRESLHEWQSWWPMDWRS